MEKIDTTLERHKKAIAEFSEMFPDWKPRPKEFHTENMIRRLSALPEPEEKATLLLQELIDINKILTSPNILLFGKYFFA